MGKGLPKKYAKMGFKKGWREYKKARAAAKRKRKSSAKTKPKSSSKRSTRSSSKGNPGGRRGMRIGKALQALKAVFNYGAAAIGSATGPGDAEYKMKNAVGRYTGYDTDSGTWDVNRALPTWQGIAATALMQYADAKTRHYGNISKLKLLDIAEEALPIFQTYTAGGDMGAMANGYNRRTTGYSGVGAWGGWDFEFLKPYATVKAVRIGLDFLGARKFINKRLPKGINL